MRLDSGAITTTHVEIPGMSLPPTVHGIAIAGSDDARRQSGHGSPVGFTINGMIGEGGMGIVYRAVQEYPSRVVALKVMKSAMSDSDRARRFQREVEILSHLNHRATPSLYSAGMLETPAGSAPFMAMELVRGERISVYCQSRGLDVRARVRLFLKVCEAVEAVHGAGIIHRDLSSHNILVDETGQPKVLDFGLATFTEAYAHEQTIITTGARPFGTLNYMSPEQALGRAREMDRQSDVYSLGVVLYKLLSDSYPFTFTGMSVVEAAKLLQEGSPTPVAQRNRALKGDLDYVISKAIAREKRNRYGSVTEFADDLQRFLEREPVLARRRRRVEAAIRYVRRRWAPLTGAGIIACAIAAGLIASHQSMRAREAERESAIHLAEASRAEGDSLLLDQDYPAAREAYLRTMKQFQQLGEDPLAAQIGLWRVGQASARPLRVLEPHCKSGENVFVSQDGRFVGIAEYAGDVRIRQVNTGQVCFADHLPGGKTGVAFSPDASFLVEYSMHAYRAVDLQKKSILWTAQKDDASITSVAASDDRIAIATDHELLTQPVKGNSFSPVRTPLSARVKALAFDGDENLIYVDEDLRIWRQSGGVSEPQLLGDFAHLGKNSAIGLSPLAKSLVVVSGRNFRLFSLPSLQPLCTIQSDDRTQAYIPFAGEERICLNDHVDGYLQLVGLDAHPTLQVPCPVLASVDFSETVGVVCCPGSPLMLYDVRPNAGAIRLGEEFGIPTAGALSSDGAAAALASADGNIRLFRGVDGRVAWTLPFHKDIRFLGFDRADSTLMAACQDGEIALIAVRDGNVRKEFHADGRILRYAYATSGDAFAVVPISPPDPILWRRHAGEWVRRTIRMHSRSHPTTMVLSAAGDKLLASGLRDGTELWNVGSDTPSLICRCENSYGDLLATFSSDEATLITGNVHQQVHRYDATTGARLNDRFRVNGHLLAIRSCDGDRTVVFARNQLLFFNPKKDAELGRLTSPLRTAQFLSLSKDGSCSLIWSPAEKGATLIDLNAFLSANDGRSAMGQ